MNLASSFSREDFARLNLTHGHLGIRIEGTDGIHRVVIEFHPHRQRRLPRIHIENPTPDGKLAPIRDLGGAFITRPTQSLRRGLEIKFVPFTDL